MRMNLLIAIAAIAGVALAAAEPEPQKTVFSRVFPQPGQIGLFIAAADGSDEHPLVVPADVDYDATWACDGTRTPCISDAEARLDIPSMIGSRRTTARWTRPSGPVLTSSPDCAASLANMHWMIGFRRSGRPCELCSPLTDSLSGGLGIADTAGRRKR
jgi:hypothetical protein